MSKIVKPDLTYQRAIAAGGFSEYMNGSIDNFKFSNGIARY